MIQTAWGQVFSPEQRLTDAKMRLPLNSEYFKNSLVNLIAAISLSASIIINICQK